MASADVIIVGNDAVARMLRQLGFNAANARPAFDDALQRVQEETTELWNAGHPVLKQSTRARKSRNGMTPQALVATGDTRRATHPLKLSTTGRSATIRVTTPQSSVQLWRGRPVIPKTRRIVGLTYQAIYRHLDVDHSSP